MSLICVCVCLCISGSVCDYQEENRLFFFRSISIKSLCCFSSIFLVFFFLNHSNSYVIEHYRSTNREPIIVSTFNLRWWLTIGGGSKAVGGKNPLDSHTSYLFSERTRSKYEHLISISVRNIKTLDLELALQQLICVKSVCSETFINSYSSTANPRERGQETINQNHMPLKTPGAWWCS